MFAYYALTNGVESDTESKTFDLIPKPSNHLKSILILNKTLYYLAREIRIFDKEEIGKVVWFPSGTEQNLLDKNKAKQGVDRIRFHRYENWLRESFLFQSSYLPTYIKNSLQSGYVITPWENHDESHDWSFVFFSPTSHPHPPPFCYINQSLQFLPLQIVVFFQRLSKTFNAL